ncbi:hypothetical protein [Streptosporangium sp. NPDC051022]|uniref:hypothetical protein n=1 Tax=Streptosporangium sp. NPDC051022 TaxID=3155752 RepID=UPI0034182C0B
MNRTALKMIWIALLPIAVAGMFAATSGVGLWGVGVFVVCLGAFIVMSFFVAGGMGNSRLLRTGLPASAVITGMGTTGWQVNGQHVLKFRLRVTPASGAPYEVPEHRQQVPPFLLGGVLPGMTVQVRTDPADPLKVCIDWSSTLPIHGAAPYGPPVKPGTSWAA